MSTWGRAWLVVSIASAVVTATLARPALAQTAHPVEVEALRTLALIFAEQRALSVELGPGHPDVLAGRARLAALAGSVARSGAGSRPERCRDAAAALRADLAAASAALVVAESRYGPRHPDVREAVARRDALVLAVEELAAGAPFDPMAHLDDLGPNG